MSVRYHQFVALQWIVAAGCSMLTPGPAIADANSAPNLDVSQSCEAGANGAIVIGRDKEACMGDERNAQDQVVNKWSEFVAADKTLCVGMVRKGGPPSYVELLSCLEIMRDAKKIRLDEPQ
jgi:hypothetical protein